VTGIRGVAPKAPHGTVPSKPPLSGSRSALVGTAMFQILFAIIPQITNRWAFSAFVLAIIVAYALKRKPLDRK